MARSLIVGTVKAALHLTIGDAEPVLLANVNLPLRADGRSTDGVWRLAVDLQELTNTVRAILTTTSTPTDEEGTN